MALLEVEGVYRDGKVELDEMPEGVQEARVRVIFLPAEDAEGQTRREAGRRLLALLREGVHLGGPPYPNREEIYEERLNRYFKKERG